MVDSPGDLQLAFRVYRSPHSKKLSDNFTDIGTAIRGGGECNARCCSSIAALAESWQYHRIRAWQHKLLARCRPHGFQLSSANSNADVFAAQWHQNTRTRNEFKKCNRAPRNPLTRHGIHGRGSWQVLVLHTDLVAKLWLLHLGQNQSPGLIFTVPQCVLLHDVRKRKLWFPHSGQNQSPGLNDCSNGRPAPQLPLWQYMWNLQLIDSQEGHCQARSSMISGDGDALGDLLRELGLRDLLLADDPAEQSRRGGGGLGVGANGGVGSGGLGAGGGSDGGRGSLRNAG